MRSAADEVSVLWFLGCSTLPTAFPLPIDCVSDALLESDLRAEEEEMVWSDPLIWCGKVRRRSFG